MMAMPTELIAPEKKPRVMPKSMKMNGMAKETLVRRTRAKNIPATGDQQERTQIDNRGSQKVPKGRARPNGSVGFMIATKQMELGSVRHATSGFLAGSSCFEASRCQDTIKPRYSKKTSDRWFNGLVEVRRRSDPARYTRTNPRSATTVPAFDC